MTPFRLIPSIEQLLRRPEIARAAGMRGHDVLTAALRAAAADLRARVARADAGLPETVDAAAQWIESRAIDAAGAHAAPSLRRVINATGVLIHTNLGRSPLAEEASRRAGQLASGYSNLEYDLDAGARGGRHIHAERLLRALTGAESALVVNNAAAAALLSLATLARGREVLVSRGELVEIGGGFRVPDVLAQSGAVLREVGTTNRTRLSDYAAALNERTAMVLRVHPSNFHIEGFTERPAIGELAALARQYSIPLVEDLGSGWLGVPDAPEALAHEPSVRASLDAGVDLVIFSGDKLLGGPQAGIIVGRRALVSLLAAHPLMRALRVDKLTYGALEATLGLWAEAPARGRLPIVRMLEVTPTAIESRARAVAAALSGVPGLACTIVDGVSTIGGGSAPGSRLPTRLLALTADDRTAASLARDLRQLEPPIIARIDDGRVVLDLRTVLEGEDEILATALRALGTRKTRPGPDDLR